MADDVEIAPQNSADSKKNQPEDRGLFEILLKSTDKHGGQAVFFLPDDLQADIVQRSSGRSRGNDRDGKYKP